MNADGVGRYLFYYSISHFGHLLSSKLYTLFDMFLKVLFFVIFDDKHDKDRFSQDIDDTFSNRVFPSLLFLYLTFGNE